MSEIVLRPMTADEGTQILCKKCEISKPLSEFYPDSNYASGYRASCRHCVKRKNDEYDQVLREARFELKQKLVDAAGGCCTKCGYKKSLAALDFHHVGEGKEGQISRMLRRALGKDKRFMDALLAETAKCILLCANCHREHHAGLFQAEDSTNE